MGPILDGVGLEADPIEDPGLDHGLEDPGVDPDAEPIEEPGAVLEEDP